MTVSVIRRYGLGVGLIALSTVFAPVVWADEVETAITEALDAYKKKDLGAAAESLDYASQLVRQQKGGALQSVLPEPLPGWEAEEATSSAAGSAFMGGGVTAERGYNKGEKHVKVSVVTDSPMLQGVMMMITNPMFATQDGGKMQRIKGQKAIVKYQAKDKSGQIQMVVNNALVTVEGEADEAELVAYAEKVNTKGLGN